MSESLERMSPIHPGEILYEEFMNPLSISQNQLASATGMPQSRIQAIISGKRGITTDTAIRLAAFFGNTPEFWLNCQTTYELAAAAFSRERHRIEDFVHPRALHMTHMTLA